MMDIEPRVQKEARRIREQVVYDDDEHEEVEGMTERPHKTHELEASPFRVFFGIVVGVLLSALVVGGLGWLFFL
ncbi:MAG: hypothetical protein J7501_12605 [Bdellovibrio sp.]|nr:hypothetical protein [Bdellovibrio sp.]